MAIKSYIKHMSDMSGEKKNNTAHGGSSGKFGDTGNVNDVNRWRQEQMNKQREKDSQLGKLPGLGGETGKDSIPGGTTATSPYDDYIKAISSAGNYDDGYWTKISNQLLANNRYGLNKANEHEKYYTDLVESYRNQNPLETDWGKAIMSQYGLDGDAAAKDEWADAAASNGGNIDSFAEANARRQRLSYLNSGVSAVNDASNQRFSNMLGALEKMGVNTANLFGIASENGQSAMGAAQDRYAQDTNSTIAYNELLQNVAPYLLGSSGDAASSMTASDRQNLQKQLQDAYGSGGEAGLLNTMELILAGYGNDSSVNSLLQQYYNAIVGIGSGGTGTTSGKPISSVTREGESYTYPLADFRSNTDDDGSYTSLPAFVQALIRESARRLGIKPSAYVNGIRNGKYATPSWLTK